MPYKYGCRAERSGYRYEVRVTIYYLLKLLKEEIDYLIIEGIREGEEDNDFNAGRHMGLFEAIDMMRNELAGRGYVFDEFMKGDD